MAKFKIGDKVKIVRKWEDKRVINWVDRDMDKELGLIGNISNINEINYREKTAHYRVRIIGKKYPYFNNGYIYYEDSLSPANTKKKIG